VVNKFWRVNTDGQCLEVGVGTQEFKDYMADWLASK
jgi:hypothetical protein